MKLKMFTIIICIQIVAIVVLFLQIQFKKNNVLRVSKNSIRSNAIQAVQNGVLKYFFEPMADLVETVHKDWLSEGAVYTLNSDSLNETKEYSITKPKGTFRIITLGDSFTFGQNISTPHNWTELLEAYLNTHNTCEKIKQFEVINLGVYAYDTQYEVERYRLRGVKYKPDLAIWTFTDFERILEQMMPLVKKYDNAENKEWERNGVYYHNWRVAREEMLKNIGKKGVIQFQKEQIGSLDVLYNGSLLYVVLDNYPEYLNILSDKANSRPHTSYLQSGIHYNQKQFFLADSHFNKKGHQKMMEEIVGALQKNNLLPCGK